MKKKAFLLLSLFFSEDEVALIKENLTDTKAPSQNLSLTSLIYYDDSHWSIWLNKKIFNPENIHELEGYELKKVTPTGAHFFCHLNQKTFSLYSHQSYAPFEEKIFDMHEMGVSF
ncbi:MAG: hypothetical protein K2Y08_05145 [Alphaproteobacteria bacterium]|nr:hypothetical protein [Alphaproteobacteria bacterium]